MCIASVPKHETNKKFSSSPCETRHNQSKSPKCHHNNNATDHNTCNQIKIIKIKITSKTNISSDEHAHASIAHGCEKVALCSCLHNTLEQTSSDLDTNNNECLQTHACVHLVY